jgi:hypothetical protein
VGNWAFQRGIRLDFVRSGKSVENAHIETFNGEFRDECLNENWFISLGRHRKTACANEPSSTANGCAGRPVRGARHRIATRSAGVWFANLPSSGAPGLSVRASPSENTMAGRDDCGPSEQLYQANECEDPYEGEAAQ